MSSDFSSTLEWCENDILYDFEKKMMGEDRTIQWSAPCVNRSSKASPEKFSGNDNRSLPNRCEWNDENGEPMPDLDVGLPQIELFNKKSLKVTYIPDKQTTSGNNVISSIGPTLVAAQSASVGFSASIVKETLMGSNMNAGLGNGVMPTLSLTKSHNMSPSGPRLANEELGLVCHTSGLETHDQEGRNQDVPKFALHPDFDVIAANGPKHQTPSLNRNVDQPNFGGQGRCEIPMTKHMTLINESNLKPMDFKQRRQFWIGESSKKQPTP